ncbi:MAG: tRNA (adenosine(37)-N6)-threonylcarbamoyltransferase complex dimerization subunit type 1 TsaB [Pseudomonadota bacterium]
MSYLLGIETSTARCSVALKCDDGGIIEQHEMGATIHSQFLLPATEKLLAEVGISISDLSGIAVSQGPGSFTGLRIGIGAAQGLAYGAGVAMTGISSLEILAAQAFSQNNTIDRAVAAIDARMGEVYWAEFSRPAIDANSKKLLATVSPRVTPPIELSNKYAGTDIFAVGNAFQEYQLLQPMKVGDMPEQAIYPTAAGLISYVSDLDQEVIWIDAMEFAPLYVRDDVAKKPLKV